MTSTPQLPLSHITTISPPHSEDLIAEPCCSYVLWGRVTVGPVDFILGGCETFTLLSAIGLGASGTYLSSGFMGGAFLSCSIAHGLYRKYGNLAEIIRQYNETEQKFHRATIQLNDEVTRLQEQAEKISQINQTLQQQALDVGKENEDLSNTIIQIHKELESLHQTNKNLKTLNAQFKEEITDLKKTNLSIKEQIALLKTQNKCFTQQIQKTAELLPKLKEVSENLETATNQADAELDEDLKDLKEELALMQNLVTQIISSFQLENQELQSAISRLKNSDAILTNKLHLVGAYKDESVALKKSYEELSHELQAIVQKELYGTKE